MTLGPRTLKAIEEGPRKTPLVHNGCTIDHIVETHEEFAHRVALIAVEEERERLLHGAEALRDPKEATDEYSFGWDSAIRAVKEAAIREGR